jgi:hypothetical protein
MGTTTYAVIDRHGEVRGTDLTLKEAAEIILTDDGQDWEIRRAHYAPSDQDFWRLWMRQQVANKPWTQTRVSSFADSLDEAETEIFAVVITSRRAAGHYWGSFTVHTMEQHAKMLADLAAEESDAA